VTITNGYLTEAQFRAAIGDSSSVQQSTIEIAIQTASRRVDALCGRRFYLDANASARYFNPFDGVICFVDDIGSLTGLTVYADPTDSGTWDQEWTVTTDFTVGPLNLLSGGLAWCYTDLRAVGTKLWPAPGPRGTVKVTAKWGWPAVPDAISMATLLIAKDLYKRPESLTGGYIGIDGWGPARIREDPAVMDMLRPYVFPSRFFVG
jgi:hypothetical protein